MLRLVVYLFLSLSILGVSGAQSREIYSNGSLIGISNHLEGENGGSSVSIVEKNEGNELSVGFSGEESWAIVYFDFISDSLDTETYRYLNFKIKSSTNFELDEIGCGEFIRNKERIYKFALNNGWQEVIMELPKSMTSLKTPFTLVGKGKGQVEIEKISYLKEVPSSIDGIKLLISSPYERIESAKYVFSENIEFGAPSGYTGENNGSSINIDDHCMDSPYKGKYCYKFDIDDSEAYRALFLQATGKWSGDLQDNVGLVSLEDYKKLVFYARSSDGYVIPSVGFGRSDLKLIQEPRDIRYVSLTNEWKRYELDLRGLDKSAVNDVMVFELAVGTFYIDEIRFEK